MGEQREVDRGREFIYRVTCRALNDLARLPARMTAGAAGWDLHACLEAPVSLEPGDWLAVPTGLVMSIPHGMEGVVRPRSGLAFRNGVGVLNSPGTIDSDYRGEVKVLLMNWGREPFEVLNGARIAQIVFQEVAPVSVEWGEVRDDTERGAGGFGHTGTGKASEPTSA